MASVRDRLRTIARQQREDYNFTLMRYANERFLYRFGQSSHRGDFVLKGAMLLPLWGAENYRPTRDIDLLGFGDPATERLSRIFGEVAVLPVEPDGMTYDADQVATEPIRGQECGAVRIRIPGTLGNIRLPVQIDIGFGDAITPPALEAEYPTLLDLPAPVLRMYPVETVIAKRARGHRPLRSSEHAAEGLLRSVERRTDPVRRRCNARRGTDQHVPPQGHAGAHVAPHRFAPSLLRGRGQAAPVDGIPQAGCACRAVGRAPPRGRTTRALPHVARDRGSNGWDSPGPLGFRRGLA